MLRVRLVSLLVLLAACTPRRAPEGTEEPPQVVLHGARLESFEGDRLALSGKAERVTYQRSGGDVTALDAVLYLPARVGDRGSAGGHTEVRAARLDVSMPTKQVTGTGGVTVRTPDGTVARAPSGTYDANAKQVRGTEGVTLKGRDFSTRSDVFQLSLADGTFTFEGSVETVLGEAQ
ncbi:hypothetical protein P2318_05110 [Myxococcaceae bacterium GXIMD 01537]